MSTAPLPKLPGEGAISKPAPVSVAPAPSTKPPPRKESWRETVESIVVAFVLAFLFRTFEAEAFVIPTGSMAPTLYGQHRDVTCTQCGVRFATGIERDEVRDGLLEPRSRSHTAVCPNCRFPNDVLSHEIFKGDRILVNKFPYEFGTPERYDVVVFKYPEEAKTNYIKRLIGLPGEEVRLEWGDVWTRAAGTDDPFRIARKKPDKQHELQLPVYDDDHPPRQLLEAGWPERWSAEQDSTWAADAAARSYRVDPNPMDPERLQWLRYRHYVPAADTWTSVALKGSKFNNGYVPSPQLITDFYAYNANITVSEVPFDEFQPDRPPDRFPEVRTESLGVQWVGDLTINASVELLEPAGELVWELVESQRRYRARIDLATGKVSLSFVKDRFGQLDDEQFGKAGDDETSLGDAESEMKSAGTYRVSFANVDDRLCLWINDKLVRSVEFDAGARYTPQEPPLAPTERDLSPVGIAARGAKLRVSHLVLERDIYYRSTARGGEEYDWPADITQFRKLISQPEDWYDRYQEQRKVGHYTLRKSEDSAEDEFFMLGDNSPRSSDSRLWERSPAVPRRLLIGKAFFIYWPHGVPFLNSGEGFHLFYYKERNLNPVRKNDPATVASDPPLPQFSVPFYPQVGRMKRIR